MLHQKYLNHHSVYSFFFLNTPSTKSFGEEYISKDLRVAVNFSSNFATNCLFENLFDNKKIQLKQKSEKTKQKNLLLVILLFYRPKKTK